jgi:hypothetical protein
MTLDAGALIAADRGDREVHVLLAETARRRMVVTVPAPVVGQVWRDGSRQARLARTLANCQIEPTTDEMARAAGVLLGRAGRADIVDALVVLGAVRRGDEILTSDPADLAALMAASPSRVPITVI